MNRDESRQRQQAHPPAIRDLPTTRALYPIDPPAGTWIGANALGLTCCLLNRNPGNRPAWDRPPGNQSRGVIIPELLTARSLSEASNILLQMQHADFAPFTLVMSDDSSYATAVLEEGNIQWSQPRTPLQPDSAYCWASSGLGDQLVEQARHPIFEDMLGIKPTPVQQDLFHHNRTGDDGSLWVAMARSDAQTVSRTTLELTPTVVHINYQRLDENIQQGKASSLTLARS